MNERLFHTWRLRLLILAISSLILTSCVPSVIAEGRPTPSLTTTTPLSTAAPTIQGLWGPATPLPNEQFTVGEIIPFTPPARRYSVRQELKAEEHATYMLFVKDNQIGHEFRLGDDSGDADFQAMTDQYIIWHRGCGFCDNPTIPPGLYAYTLATKEQIFITQAGDGVKAAGNWIIYGLRKNTEDHASWYYHTNWW